MRIRQVIHLVNECIDCLSHLSRELFLLLAVAITSIHLFDELSQVVESFVGATFDLFDALVKHFEGLLGDTDVISKNGLAFATLCLLLCDAFIGLFD